MDAEQVLDGVRRELREENARYLDPDMGPRLDYAPCGVGFRVWAFGLDVPLDVLARDPVARALVSLTIDSSDVGANGVCNWDLTEFADGSAQYPSLAHLRIARNAPDRHNRCIVAQMYDEDGVLGRIARKAPFLESLETPSAPRPNFLKADLSNLSHLRWMRVSTRTVSFRSSLMHRSLRLNGVIMPRRTWTIGSRRLRHLKT